MKILSIGVLLWFASYITAYGQAETVDQLMKEQETQDNAQRTELAMGTFESSRLIAGHSVETSKKRSLDLRISHRFGPIDGGFYEFFGLDNASVRVGMDYGITDRLTVGFGRSTWDKEFDFPVTYRILRQSSGQHNMPVSVTVLGEWMIRTLKDSEGNIPSLGDMTSTALQLLIARKFSNVISAQVMPIWIHYVKTPQDGDPNDIFSIGLGGSVKILKRVRFNAEYYPLFSGNKLSGTVSPFSCADKPILNMKHSMLNTIFFMTLATMVKRIGVFSRIRFFLCYNICFIPSCTDNSSFGTIATEGGRANTVKGRNLSIFKHLIG